MHGTYLSAKFEIIKEMEEVEECCVVASPHPEKVKEASCHIVLKHQYRDLKEENLENIISKIISIVEEKTSKMYTYYIPGTYEFRKTELPKTSFGKIDFVKLEKENLREFESNGGKALRKIRYE